MDWTNTFIDSIDYIESNLEKPISVSDISENVNVSSFYFQKAFLVYTGYNVHEYIRSRRLYKAALEIINGNDKIIDIAYKYCYETPESFTKAFTRFHNATPKEVKNGLKQPRTFLPLKIHISIVGGNEMDYKVEKEVSLTFIGFKKNIKAGNGYVECPKFWDEVFSKYASKMGDGTEVSLAMEKNSIGSFAVCINQNEDSFDYYICGKYEGGDVPSCMELVTIKDSLWAKFNCVGPLPGALQSVNERIWKEWLPNNNKYELNFECDVEFYSKGDTNDQNYKSEIWLPVKEK